jgi:hypothetical protein
MEKAMTALAVLGISEQELLKRDLIARPSADPALPTFGNILESLGWARNVMQAFRNGSESPDVTEKLMEDFQNRQSSNPMMKEVSEAMKFWTSTEVVVDHDEGLMIVQGEQHFYRLFLSSGKIERVTDNAELELDWEQIPDNLRVMFQSEPDLPSQCNLLAGFLRRDSVYGRYFRVKKG